MTDDTEARRLVRAQLFEAGATLSTAVFGGRQYLTCWLPNDAPDDLLDEAKADGWVVVLGKPLQGIDRSGSEEQPHARSDCPCIGARAAVPGRGAGRRASPRRCLAQAVGCSAGHRSVQPQRHEGLKT